MVDVLNEKVLVLNRNFIVLCAVDAKTALKMIFSGKATIMDGQYVNYSIEEWEKISPANKKVVRTPTKVFIVPEIIRLKEFDQVISKIANLTKQNVFIRDDFTCQYCGSSPKDLSIDHIIPKSRAREFNMTPEQINSWENMVACCLRCNAKKDNKTLKEVGMKLLQKPKRPNYSFLGIEKKLIKKSWEPFIQIVIKAHHEK